MRIVVDLQGAQTASRFRGIGRYSLALAQALARNAGSHEIWLVMNGAFADLEQLQQAFAGLVPRSRMRVFDPPLPLAEMVSDNGPRARSAEMLREFFIQQLAPDAVLVTSLFEGFIDDAVVSIGSFIDGARTAVVLYDLIPYLNPAAYLATQEQQDYYARKIDSLRRAGLLLAISDHAAREAVDTLGLDAGKVVPVSTAVDARFQPGEPADAAQLRQLGIERQFVMYAPGGVDARKNLEGLIVAFALLPPSLQQSHQLLIASKIEPQRRAELLQCAARHGLASDALVLSGYIDDALLIGLYRAARLFVFPSLHEGFGLPALEAMACGAPVIGADNSSIPEVIGLSEALFDGADPAAIAAAMARALSDPAFLQHLRTHGAIQARAFSWDRTALRCLHALEHELPAATPGHGATARRPRLAFVSPLPPERSGIADYAAQLLPALLPYFDVELVLRQRDVALPPALADLPRRSAAWFMEHARQFDQILYQFGNSPFHGHMFALLAAHPGVVVLHDFYLSRVLGYEQLSGAMPGAWTDALYHSHGYPGLLAAGAGADPDAVYEAWPCNLAVLQDATAVIVHSMHSKQLGEQWYGADATGDWHVVPLPRTAPAATGRADARRLLGIDEQVFMVCSFGFIAPTKLTDLLIAAWRSSAAGADAQCLLVLVGANDGGAYGEQIAAAAKAAGAGVRIAGWTDDARYHQYLCAADGAVQLRCASRGETSAAVLDCLNYGLPTIVNANGSMAELPPDAVCMLDEEVSVEALRGALDRLRGDPAWRRQLGANAGALLAQRHRPAECAAQYVRVLAAAAAAAATQRPALETALTGLTGLGAADLQQVAASMAQAPAPLMVRQLLVDVTTIADGDLRTGIERVVRAQVLSLLRQGSRHLRIEPVRLVEHHGNWQYRYAHAWTQALLGIDADGAPDHLVDIRPGDILFGADYAPKAVAAAAAAGLYANWRARGVAVHFQVFDLLPVLTPQFFPEGADQIHAAWLAAIGAAADQLICISHAVAQELVAWLRARAVQAPAQQRIAALHLGADFDGDADGGAVAPRSKRAAGATPTFLMVATIEPRKGHLQTLAAFALLWQRGVDVALTIVGREGWATLAAPERRTIPRIMTELRRLLKQQGARLTWVQGIDDQRLEQLYRESDCLLVPSEGEGFGLPLIEAARHGLPILARELPVFREVAGERISYFKGDDAAALADAIAAWLAADGRASAVALPWLTWRQHTAMLLRMLEPG